MNALIVAVFACLAVASAAPSGLGAVVAGPAGIVTGHGAIGPIGLGHGGIGLGHGAVVAGPALGLGLGGLGGWGGWGVGGLGLGHGVGVITNGGGAIGIGHGGVAVRGPHTVPATIAGPSGSIHANGLWGPTLAGGHGVHGW